MNRLRERSLAPWSVSGDERARQEQLFLRIGREIRIMRKAVLESVLLPLLRSLRQLLWRGRPSLDFDIKWFEHRSGCPGEILLKRLERCHSGLVTLEMVWRRWKMTGMATVTVVVRVIRPNWDR